MTDEDSALIELAQFAWTKWGWKDVRFELQHGTWFLDAQAGGSGRWCRHAVRNELEAWLDPPSRRTFWDRVCGDCQV